MKGNFSIPKIAIYALLAVSIGGIFGTVFLIQQQQDPRSRASETAWYTSQSASSSCSESGAVINVTFKNTESNRSYYSMNVVATDKQTGKKVNLGSIAGGQSKTGKIDTGKTSLSASSVTFALTWTDGHSGQDSRTANYSAVSNCGTAPTPTTIFTTPPVDPCQTIQGIYYPGSGYVTPTKSSSYPTPTKPATPTPTYVPCPPTVTPKPTASPTPTPPANPTPTICPTLNPVKNVRIECPNCQ